MEKEYEDLFKRIQNAKDDKKFIADKKQKEKEEKMADDKFKDPKRQKAKVLYREKIDKAIKSTSAKVSSSDISLHKNVILV